ncbi:hypothetical protein GJA_1851 [Janthinobacterium agaricidamnosum NBRC 102515 = DSM 9628]|uniref:Uncharacterized protein n=1 Tax=Janthinobacterium agaricidamnosum NBRC 102515 = DSM 9628 TaxID=1349767 RepID=W0V5G0_9BURK|nr:hypothetical protein GJA_1851 [Janthinobacterium agaricidamnosum NBRC 102515 = DSM 9628]
MHNESATVLPKQKQGNKRAKVINLQQLERTSWIYPNAS